MISATKGPTPRCLTTLAATPGADWDGSVYGEQRQEIREALARDQGTLCAYCQRRARPAEGAMRIDHWHPRTAGGEHFQWSNLVGSCAHQGTCDDLKGQTRLFLHPFDGHGPDPRRHLRYTGAGLVQATDDDDRVTADIRTLGLNAFHLQRGRKAALEGLTRLLDRSGFTVTGLRAELRRCEAIAGCEAPEFAGVLAHQLRRWLRKRVT